MSLQKADLFERALIKPLDEGANKLYIVSGYATALMAMRHIEFAKRIHKDFSIELIVGMCSKDGIEKSNHLAFKELQSKKFGVDFSCNYIVNTPPVHSKVYAWYQDSKPVTGFIGSANYTQNAFSKSMREVLSFEEPKVCLDYYKSLIGETVSCTAENVPDLIDIFEKRIIIKAEESTEALTAVTSETAGLEKVTLPLVDSRGEVPGRSGLNWGQRPGREHNQAYINIPAHVGRSGFFPDRFENFTVVTDDGKQIVCVRAQDAGKGIHSTLNNSLLGEYFRYRLGLANGAFVKAEHLLSYGRTDVTFYKIDEENYLMDFAVH